MLGPYPPSAKTPIMATRSLSLSSISVADRGFACIALAEEVGFEQIPTTEKNVFFLDYFSSMFTKRVLKYFQSGNDVVTDIGYHGFAPKSRIRSVV